MLSDVVQHSVWESLSDLRHGTVTCLTLLFLALIASSHAHHTLTVARTIALTIALTIARTIALTIALTIARTIALTIELTIELTVALTIALTIAFQFLCRS